MNRQPSLAAGISGAGFEWNPSPSRTTPSVPSDFNTELHLTFASVPADDSNSRPAQSAFATQSQAGTGADTPASSEKEHKNNDENTAGEDKSEDSSMSADTTQAKEAGAGPLFSTMQTRAPGLTPLRLTPKTEPAQPRSASQPCHHPAPLHVLSMRMPQTYTMMRAMSALIMDGAIVHLRTHSHLHSSSD